VIDAISRISFHTLTLQCVGVWWYLLLSSRRDLTGWQEDSHV